MTSPRRGNAAGLRHRRSGPFYSSQEGEADKISNSDTKMTLQEKLDYIDDEIRKIHIFCTKSGYTASQLEHFAKPFFQKEGQHFTASIWVSGKAWKRRTVALAAMLVAMVLLFRFDPAYQVACALSKQGAIQVSDICVDFFYVSFYNKYC